MLPPKSLKTTATLQLQHDNYYNYFIIRAFKNFKPHCHGREGRALNGVGVPPPPGVFVHAAEFNAGDIGSRV